ncbi:MAG: hypothetical protein IJU76_05070 [Desulfovibrionaceae bacterium]|nr:hypothetical protein [Desulfovibrionaceae bacterium]
METVGSLLTNLTSALSGLAPLFETVAAVLGIAFVGYGLLALIDHARFGHSLAKGLTSLGIGFLLVGINAFASALSLSLFEEEISLAREVGKVRADALLSPYFSFAVTVVFLVGSVSVIRGLLFLRRVGAGQESCFWPGVSHLLAGVLCLNIVTFARFFGNTCGGLVQNLITHLFP